MGDGNSKPSIDKNVFRSVFLAEIWIRQIFMIELEIFLLCNSLMSHIIDNLCVIAYFYFILSWHFEFLCIHCNDKFSYHLYCYWRANSEIQIARRWISSYSMRHICIDTIGCNIYKFERQKYSDGLALKCCGCYYHLKDFEPLLLKWWMCVLKEQWCTTCLLVSMH